MNRRAIVFWVCALGVATGVFSLHMVREEPAFSFAGASVARAPALLGAGWALISCGLAFGTWRPDSPFGALRSPGEACSQCPHNLVLVVDRGGLAADVTRTGVYIGAAWALVLTKGCGRRFSQARLSRPAVGRRECEWQPEAQAGHPYSMSASGLPRGPRWLRFAG